MKYLSQFLIIMGFTLAGEALQRLVPLPIPASVYGIVLLFAALCLGLVKVEQVKDAGGFLTSILPILFVSPAVGLLENWALIRDAVLPMFLLVLASTALTFGISGRVAQHFMKKGGGKHDCVFCHRHFSPGADPGGLPDRQALSEQMEAAPV